MAEGFFRRGFSNSNAPISLDQWPDVSSVKKPLHGEFHHYSAIGVWYSPRQCCSHSYEPNLAGKRWPSAFVSGVRPFSPECVRCSLKYAGNRGALPPDLALSRRASGPDTLVVSCRQSFNEWMRQRDIGYCLDFRYVQDAQIGLPLLKPIQR